MRVLVTGQDGCIGALLVALLQRAGHDVVGVDADLFSGCLFGQEAARVQSLRKDIRGMVLDPLRGFYAITQLAERHKEECGLQELPAV